MTPILRTPTSGPPSVDSFLAIVDSPTVPGTSLRSVWYKRSSPVLGGGWEAKAWDSENQWEAIRYVKLELGIGDEFDGIWPTTDNPELLPEERPEIPTDYVSGLKANDPLAGVLALPGRDLIVEVLVAVGYKAADIPFEKAEYADACGFETVLDAFAIGAEAGYSVSPNNAAEAMASATQASLAASCGAAWCIPWITSGPWALVLPVTWTSGPWIGPQCTPTIGGCSACTYWTDICRKWTRNHFFVWPNCSTSTWTTTTDECWRYTLVCSNTGGSCPPAPAPDCVPTPMPTNPPPGTPTTGRP